MYMYICVCTCRVKEWEEQMIMTFVVSVLPVPAGPAGAPPNFRCSAPVSVK